MKIILLFISIFFSAFSFADGGLEIVLGFGQVNAKLTPTDIVWAPEKIQELETDLLIDERLAPFVTGKSRLIVQISNSELKAAVAGGTDFSQLKNLILDKATVLARRDQKQVAEESREFDRSDDIFSDTEDESGRVVVGSSIEVGKDEVVDELVVVAGTADIHGTVGKLVVVGGNVHLYSTAKITEEINLIGGNIEKDDGAEILGKQVEVAVPLSSNTWNLVLDGIEGTSWGHWISSAWGKFFFSLLKIVILMIIAYMGYWAAPAYQDAVYFFVKESPVSSFAWGIFSVFLVLPITMFLCLSIVGIPLLPLQFSLLCLFALLGYIHVGQYLFRTLLNKVSSTQVVNSWVIILLGLISLELIDLIPYLGSWITSLLGLAGFGAANKVFYGILLKRKARAQSLF